MRGEYLFRRGRSGIFYFRWPVPRHLQARLGKKQVWKSLGTQNYLLAQCRAARLWAAVQEEALGMGTGNGSGFFYDLKVLLNRRAHQDGSETADKSITISGIHTQDDLERAKELLALATAGAAPAVASAPEWRGQGQKQGPKCSEAFGKYAAEKHQVVKSWTDNTRKEIEATFRLFLDIVGDHPLETYADPARARDLRAALLRLPPNWRTSPRWRNQTIRQILAGPPPDKTQAVKTINKKIRFIAGFFDWYCKLHSDILPSHPYGSLVVPVARRDRKRDRDERNQFTPEQVRLMLASSAEERSYPYRFWAVALGAHTGARVNELAQLYVDDIQEIGGLWAFRFRENQEDQRLKTDASLRTVPVHPALIAAGFLEFVEERRRLNAQGRLFPELPRGSKGDYGSGWSKWFSAFRARLGIGGRQYGFHSFRHTVSTALAIAGVPGSFADDLTGHERGSGGQASEREIRYVKTPEVGKLAEYIGKLDYGMTLAKWPGLSKFDKKKQRQKQRPERRRK